jgi:integrase
MVSVSKDNKGWRIDIRLPSGERKVIRLGPDCTRRPAESIAVHIRALLAAKAAGSVPEAATVSWLSKCGDRLHARLKDIGLVSARERDQPVVVWMDKHLALHAASITASAGTHKVWGRARRHAAQFFSDRRLSTLTKADAAAFRTWLLKQPGKTSPTLAEATVRKTCGVLSQCCRAAVEAGMITANPFVNVPKSAGANAAREAYVTADTIRRVMQAMTDAEARLLTGCSRFGGVRVPSEIRTLRWGDVDWEQHALRVDSPKTAKQGKPWRLVPIVPELFNMLQAAFHAAPEGGEFIFPRLRLHTNPAMPVLRAVREAGVEPWPRTFHALRASCETDWAAIHPIADVAAWMGHSRVVAARHYLRSTDASFAAVTGRSVGRNVVSLVVTTLSKRWCHRW